MISYDDMASGGANEIKAFPPPFFCATTIHRLRHLLSIYMTNKLTSTTFYYDAFSALKHFFQQLAHDFQDKAHECGEQEDIIWHVRRTKTGAKAAAT